MTEAHARNMSISELVPFAQQELDNLQLVLAHPPVALAQLVERTPDVAVKAQRLDALLFDYGVNSVDDVDAKLDRIKEMVDLFDADDIDELATKLKALREVMTEFDMVDAHDVGQELKRLKKLAQQIEDACNQAGIEINC